MLAIWLITIGTSVALSAMATRVTSNAIGIEPWSDRPTRRRAERDAIMIGLPSLQSLVAGVSREVFSAVKVVSTAVVLLPTCVASRTRSRWKSVAKSAPTAAGLGFANGCPAAWSSNGGWRRR